MGAHRVPRHGENVVLLVDDDLHLGRNADEQAGVAAADRHGGAEVAFLVGHGVDAGQSARHHRVPGGVAGDVALHAGGQFAHRTGGNGHFHRQVVDILDGGHRAAADRTHRGVQLGDGAVHGGGQGAVLQGGLQVGHRVGGAAGLFQLGLGIVHGAGVAGHGVVVGLLGFVQRLAVLLDLVVILADGVKALQPQLGNAALALGNVQLVLVVGQLALHVLLTVSVAVVLGLGQLDLQVGDGVFQSGDLLGVQAVVVFHQFPVGAGGAGAVLHGGIIVGQAQGVVVLLGFVQVLLQLGQVGGLVFHALVIAGLGFLQAVAVVLLGGGQLFLHLGGVQRGDDVPFVDSVSHRHIHRRDLVGLDGIRSGNAGRGTGSHRAVDADRIGQAGFLQGGGAYELVGQGCAGSGGAAQKVHHKGDDKQHNHQKDGQLFVTLGPVQRVMAPKPAQWAAAHGVLLLRHNRSETPFARKRVFYALSVPRNCVQILFKNQIQRYACTSGHIAV